MNDRFDVFLCHNSEDKPEVKKIGLQLKERGLRPWLDEWELRPGMRWQGALEEHIDKIDTAAVFVGSSGIGPWQQMEIETILCEFVKRNCPVIPVILNGGSESPELPLFLGNLTWVDFRLVESDPLERLIWGITGQRHRRSGVTSMPIPAGREDDETIFGEKDDQDPTIKWILVLSSTINECNKTKVEAIIDHLRTVSEDTSLTLKEIKTGSIKLILEGSPEGFQRIKMLFEEGKFSKILGIKVDLIEKDHGEKAKKTEEKKPVVLISYSHDSKDHSERVRGLGISLAQDGCDCRLDVEKNTNDDWPTWMTSQLLDADFVLCVATQTYENRFREKEQADAGLGVGWEAGLIRRLLYKKKLRNDKIFPIFFESTDEKSIPIELQGYDYFHLDGQSDYEDLLRKIHNKPRYKKPASGSIPNLPTHRDNPLFARPGTAVLADSPPTTSSEKDRETTVPEDEESRKDVQENQLSNVSEDNRPDIDTKAKYAELEIELHHRDLNCYRVIMRPSVWPETDDDQLARPLRYFLYLDASKPAVYSGEDLAKRLFPTEKDRPESLSPRDLFARIRAHASEPKIEFRFRIAISASAMELHQISWENLRDPCNLERSLLDCDIFFSRHLLGFDQDWHEVRLRPKPRAAARRWLLTVSSPVSALLPKKTDYYRSHAINRLPGYGVVDLISDRWSDVTEELLISRLSDNQGWEVLYLVCRCAMIEDLEGLERVRPAIVLQDSKGEPVKVSAESIARRLSELSDPPRMVILAPPEECHDAALRVAPILLESGIACALVVPEGNDKLYDELIGCFFKKLDEFDRTDKAMCEARRSLSLANKEYAFGESYKHMPVLLTRLKTSKIWYKPGFLNWNKTENKWNKILKAIEMCSLTPILGPGLTEHIVGTRREIARHWARDCNYPMSYWDRINLPQVAQYLTVNPPGQKAINGEAPEGEEVPNTDPKKMLYKELDKVVRKHIGKRYPKINTRDDQSLDDILKEALKRGTQNDEDEPHRILAELGLPLYVTTNMNSLLEQALEAVPDTRWCNDPVIEATEKPVVHHLFGKFDDPADLVLSEDEHFDYLIDVTRDVRSNKMLSSKVRYRLTDASLLFLGFSLHHWDFRILIQVLKSFAGSKRRTRFDHVAVQVDPDDDYIVDPERARRHLETYFLYPARASNREENFSISIFWGTAEDFLHELKQRRERI